MIYGKNKSKTQQLYMKSFNNATDLCMPGGLQSTANAETFAGILTISQ